ncbi:hypothetical protein PRIPAC_97189 [Pristionchus pacificus]|uniref:Uncharacterized protein n=1 Tax=Pristionchus pacificus TaxID=54126 RepID=A0A2A6CU08_PRIPA|nr:hypothetical protein PRIPAC_97189 [Pristionchus pacificus]|eukprot:PDM81714.1 hypothetical protein PRIPAC_30695 [Pristionchus pacificus]
MQDLGAEALSPEFLDDYLPKNRPEVKKEVKEERKTSMEQRIPNGNGGEMGDQRSPQQQGQQQQQQMYYASADPRMSQERYERYSQQMMVSQPSGPSPASMQYTAEQQQQMQARTPEMHNGTPQMAGQQQLTLEQQQQLSAQRQAMMQRQYSSPALTGRPQEVSGQPMNGMVATSTQMAMNQGGFISPTYAHAQQTYVSYLPYTEQQARLALRQRQHPHLSAQPRSASMGSLPMNQQQPPAYQQYHYGQPRPNGMNPFTANGTPVPSNWQMAFQTEMPPAFLNYYHPGKAHPYFDHARRNLQYPYPMGTKDLGDRLVEPLTFGYLPDSIYFNPANDRRSGKGADPNFGGPSTSKAPKKRGAGAAGGGAGAKKQRRTNSDQADDARFVQPYPPNMTAQQQQRMASTTSSVVYPSGSGPQSFDGFTQPALPVQQQQQQMMQQSTPHMQLQRQMSAPAYSGLAQSAQESMQAARQQQQQALAHAQAQQAQAQAQYAAQQQQQQQQQPTNPVISHDGYQQSANGDSIFSDLQWRSQYTPQPTTPTAVPSQPVFRSPQPTNQQPAFNSVAQQQTQQSQQPGSNEQMYWNQQQ